MKLNDLVLFDRLEVIRNVIKSYGEDKFYISFSGGKDSTVLHYIIDEALPENKIPRVYFNTGVEYTDILKFVRSIKKKDERMQIVNSNVHIPTMLKEKGYPFKSKEHSHKVNVYQNSGMTKTIKKYLLGVNDDGTPSQFKCPKTLRYQFSEDFDLKISDRCCFELKKKVAIKWETENNRNIAILGLRMAEGGIRETHKGCPFSTKLQEQLEVMARLLPSERKQCEYIWKPVYDEYRRIGYRIKKNEQGKLF